MQVSESGSTMGVVSSSASDPLRAGGGLELRHKTPDPHHLNQPHYESDSYIVNSITAASRLVRIHDGPDTPGISRRPRPLSGDNQFRSDRRNSEPYAISVTAPAIPISVYLGLYAH